VTTIQAHEPPKPRMNLVTRACDFIDLQHGFRRATRSSAEEALLEWRGFDELTHLERTMILNRYDSPSS
jgi:hypothetical protein